MVGMLSITVRAGGFLFKGFLGSGTVIIHFYIMVGEQCNIHAVCAVMYSTVSIRKGNKRGSNLCADTVATYTQALVRRDSCSNMLTVVVGRIHSRLWGLLPRCRQCAH
jgi:hypothetical protein